MRARVLAVLSGVTMLAACTSSGTPAPTGTPTTSPGKIATGSPGGPIASGPTHAAAATSCPYVGVTFVHDTMGMRLGRITVLRSGGRVVGCRFYALQNSPLHNSEHLPGPRQPVVEITTQRYPSAVAAHNAFVLLARRGANPQQVDLGHAVGVCFRTRFYPKDAGKDVACATSVGATEVVVRTVDTTGTFSPAQLTRTVLRHVGSG